MLQQPSNNSQTPAHCCRMINKDCGTYRVGLFDIDVEIDYNSEESRDLIDFLFRDLSSKGAPVSNRRFEVLIVGRPARISLWLGERQLYFGDSKREMAHILVNEIIYDCITNNNDFAVHAAAFHIGNCGLIMPGKSGSGKSSLAAWLTSQGYGYLTDELVLLSKEGIIRSFTRPISLKPPSYEVLNRLIPLDEEEFLVGQNGAMISHRSLNGSWAEATPSLDILVYPEFKENHPTTLTEISSARSCLNLMECYVNARNIPNHGFKELAELTRRAVSYELKFSSFNELKPVFQQLTSPPSNNAAP